MMIGRKKCSLLGGLNTSEAELQTIIVSIYFIFWSLQLPCTGTLNSEILM